jgi:hypothetical protein
MQFSPPSRHLFSLRSEHPPQHFDFKDPEPMYGDRAKGRKGL